MPGVVALVGRSQNRRRQTDGQSTTKAHYLRLLSLILPVTLLTACANLPQNAAPSTDAQGASAGIARSSAVLAPTQIATLDNMSKNEVLARLGQPDFTRSDPPAEIWQYRSVGCVLDLFMYPEAAGDLHVAHAVSRNPNSAQTPADSCTPFPAPSRTASAS